MTEKGYINIELERIQLEEILEKLKAIKNTKKLDLKKKYFLEIIKQYRSIFLKSYNILEQREILAEVVATFDCDKCINLTQGRLNILENKAMDYENKEHKEHKENSINSRPKFVRSRVQRFKATVTNN